MAAGRSEYPGARGGLDLNRANEGGASGSRMPVVVHPRRGVLVGGKASGVSPQEPVKMPKVRSTGSRV